MKQISRCDWLTRQRLSHLAARDRPFCLARNSLLIPYNFVGEKDKNGLVVLSVFFKLDYVSV